MRKNTKNMLLIGVICGLVLWAFPVFSWPVPDTGQTACYNADGTTITCPESGQPFAGQDGNNLINPPSFTKLDASGNELADSAASWVMVRDNVTGLVWEVKTDDGTIHDKDNTYTWYDPNPETNGGSAGTNIGDNNSNAFIDAINTSNFGGYSDWRIPTRKELRSIAIYGWSGPSIKPSFFPNTKSSKYWSSTTHSQYNDWAWAINFSDGDVFRATKYNGCSYTSCINYYFIRAVRGGD